MFSALNRDLFPRRNPRHIPLGDESGKKPPNSSSFLCVLSDLCGHFVIQKLKINIPGGIDNEECRLGSYRL